MNKRYRKTAALWLAAMFLGITLLTAGCGGGGGGGGVPPTEKTTFTGRVVGPTGQVVVGATIGWKWFGQGQGSRSNRSRSRQDLTTDNGGMFTIDVPAKSGQVIITAYKNDVGKGETLPYPLNGASVAVNTPIQLKTTVRSDSFEPNCVQVGHRIQVKLGERLPDKIELLRQISGHFSDLVIDSQNTMTAQGELKVELLFSFNNIPAEGGAEDWRVKAILEFAKAIDRTKPNVQVIPLSGTQSGTITVTGTAVDVDGRPVQGSQVSTSRMQKSGIDITITSTPTSRACQIEAPPSGVAKVEMNYTDGAGKAQKAQTVTDSQNRFSFNLNTKTLGNGLTSLMFVAFDKATPANQSVPVQVDIDVYNDSPPPADPWLGLPPSNDSEVLRFKETRTFNVSGVGGSPFNIAMGRDETIYLTIGGFDCAVMAVKPDNSFSKLIDQAGEGIAIDKLGRIFSAWSSRGEVVRFGANGARELSATCPNSGFIKLDENGDIWTAAVNRVSHVKEVTENGKPPALKVVETFDFSTVPFVEAYDVWGGSIVWASMSDTITLMRRRAEKNIDVPIGSEPYRNVYGPHDVVIDAKRGQIICLVGEWNAQAQHYDQKLLQVSATDGHEIARSDAIPLGNMGDPYTDMTKGPLNPDGSFDSVVVYASQANQAQIWTF